LCDRLNLHFQLKLEIIYGILPPLKEAEFSKIP